jgi:aryl-phospho-beta-D-glucosidase BglC (GH1 family)
LGLLRAHRDSFITERDFAELARRRIDAVRLPVPYFAFGDHQSYLGCVDHLDRAFVWAERHRIAVLLDLHTCRTARTATTTACAASANGTVVLGTSTSPSTCSSN